MPALALVTGMCTLGGCAHNVRATYPSTGPGVPVGSVTVKLTSAARNLSVTVNGVLVAEGKHTKKVTVLGVPAGPAEVGIACGGGGMSRVEKTARVEVEPYADTAVLVSAPNMSTASPIYVGLYNLGTWVFLGALYTVIL
jgi:hypothetical protein